MRRQLTRTHIDEAVRLFVCIQEMHMTLGRVPSYQMLATAAGLSLNKVGRLMQLLKRWGWISYIPYRPGTVRITRVTECIVERRAS